MAATVKLSTCSLCEAMCGLRVEMDGGRVVGVRGDKDDPLSRGHICPKAAALPDLSADPDRVTTPLRRIGDRFEPVPWDAAIADIADRLTEITAAHGRDAVALYAGNPTVHSDGALLYGGLLLAALRTKNLYSSNSVDGRPRLLTSYAMYGSQVHLPIPDIDHTDHLVILGANPLVSNGSIMTAPGFGDRIKAIRARGGKVVVIDPRRTETADKADEHHFIRPSTDAALLAAMLHTIAEEGLAARLDSGRFDGLEPLWRAVKSLSPERVAAFCGVEAAVIRTLARDFAAADRAVVYGRLGTCAQSYGALTTWLIDCLNIVTGNFDSRGGAMFTTPALAIPKVAGRGAINGSYDRFRSRVSGLPEFAGELPLVALAEEIETAGPGQVRALVTHAGNPALSAPNGKRLDRALGTLDFMVSIDIYINETTRHADYILPAAVGLERDHYGVVFSQLAVHNVAKFAPAVLEPPGDVRQDWRILLDLSRALWARRGLRGRAASAAASLLSGGPRRIIDAGLRLGRHRLSVAKLLDAPSGLDLGPLVPNLVSSLEREGRAVQMFPTLLAGDLPRLETAIGEGESVGGDSEFTLIGRRTLRSNNSWMHNVPRLMRGRTRCTLMMHPSDAERCELADGDSVRVSSVNGSVDVPLEVTDDIMPGLVSLPHGFGHNSPGTRGQVAAEHAGASANSVTDDALFDPISGTAALFETRVSVAPA